MNRSSFASLVAEYARWPAQTLPQRLDAAVARRPRCPVARYLLGCHCLDRGRIATAVRHMMIAHHAEPDLQSAALLVFAGLNCIRRRGETLLPVLLDTWEEFRRPEFDRYAKERLLLDAFVVADPGLGHTEQLARRLWRLPIPSLRAQIREAMRTHDGGLYAILTAPA